MLEEGTIRWPFRSKYFKKLLRIEETGREYDGLGVEVAEKVSSFNPALLWLRRACRPMRLPFTLGKMLDLAVGVLEERGSFWQLRIESVDESCANILTLQSSCAV